MSENRFEIYKNYGVLGAEKRGVFTYGVPASTATCSDKFLVELPENKYFSLYYNTMDQLMVESSWGGHYTVNELCAEMRSRALLLWKMEKSVWYI